MEQGCAREIILAMQEKHIAGIAILKKTEKEKKICTLKVQEPFRYQGIAKKLIEHSFEYLETEQAFITIRSSKQEEFRQYDFRLESIESTLNHTELIYHCQSK